MYQGVSYEVSQALPLALQSGLFSSTIGFLAPTGAMNAAGSPLTAAEGGYGPVAGLPASIQCDASPLLPNRIAATEMRDLEEIMASAPLHVLLAGYYPQIENGVANGWLATIDGGAQYYIVLGAESDSQGQFTRVEVKLVQI